MPTVAHFSSFELRLLYIYVRILFCPQMVLALENDVYAMLLDEMIDR